MNSPIIDPNEPDEFEAIERPRQELKECPRCHVYHDYTDALCLHCATGQPMKVKYVNVNTGAVRYEVIDR